MGPLDGGRNATDVFRVTVYNSKTSRRQQKYLQGKVLPLLHELFALV